MSDPTPIKKRRGAPNGNINALKHGFYSSKFHRSELAALPENFKGLQEEISMIRLTLRQLVEHTLSAPNLYDYNDSVRILCLACNTLNRFLRTHLILSQGGDEFGLALQQALEELNREWNLDGKGGEPLIAPPPPARLAPPVN